MTKKPSRKLTLRARYRKALAALSTQWDNYLEVEAERTQLQGRLDAAVDANRGLLERVATESISRAGLAEQLKKSTAQEEELAAEIILLREELARLRTAMNEQSEAYARTSERACAAEQQLARIRREVLDAVADSTLREHLEALGPNHTGRALGLVLASKKSAEARLGELREISSMLMFWPKPQKSIPSFMKTITEEEATRGCGCVLDVCRLLDRATDPTQIVRLCAWLEKRIDLQRDWAASKPETAHFDNYIRALAGGTIAWARHRMNTAPPKNV